MIRQIIILFTSLLLISACSSSDEQDRAEHPAPAATVELMDSRSEGESTSPASINALKKSHKNAPIILIQNEDDDMQRLD